MTWSRLFAATLPVALFAACSSFTNGATNTGDDAGAPMEAGSLADVSVTADANAPPPLLTVGGNDAGPADPCVDFTTREPDPWSDEKGDVAQLAGAGGWTVHLLGGQDNENHLRLQRQASTPFTKSHVAITMAVKVLGTFPPSPTADDYLDFVKQWAPTRNGPLPDNAFVFGSATPLVAIALTKGGFDLNSYPVGSGGGHQGGSASFGSEALSLLSPTSFTLKLDTTWGDNGSVGITGNDKSVAIPALQTSGTVPTDFAIEIGGNRGNQGGDPDATYTITKICMTFE